MPKVKTDKTAPEWVGVRELGQRVSRVIDDVEAGKPVIVTRRGRPIAMMTPIDLDDLEEHVLGHAAEFRLSMLEAEEALAAGEARTLDDVLNEIGEGPSPAGSRARRQTGL